MAIVLNNLSAHVIEALHQKAAAEGRSVQEVAVEAMALGLEISGSSKRDLSDIVGTWVDDPEFDEAMKDFERVDPE